MARSSIDGTTVVLVVDELVDVVELDVEVVDGSVELVATVVVLGSCVSMTDITESGSTINTCVSFFNRRTSALSNSATNPFTLLENTSLTSLPSEVSLFTFAATLTESFRMTM